MAHPDKPGVLSLLSGEVDCLWMPSVSMLSGAEGGARRRLCGVEFKRFSTSLGYRKYVSVNTFRDWSPGNSDTLQCYKCGKHNFGGELGAFSSPSPSCVSDAHVPAMQSMPGGLGILV